MSNFKEFSCISYYESNNCHAVCNGKTRFKCCKESRFKLRCRHEQYPLTLSRVNDCTTKTDRDCTNSTVRAVYYVGNVEDPSHQMRLNTNLWLASPNATNPW